MKIKEGFICLNVPNDVLLLIMEELDLSSFINFIQVSKKLYNWIIKNETLWKSRCIQFVQTWNKGEELQQLYELEHVTKSKKSWWRQQLVEYYTLYGISSYYNRKLVAQDCECFEEERILNIVAIGAGATEGKTQTIERFVQGTYVDKYDPTIEGSYAIDIPVGSKIFLLDILDTAGQEEYAALRDNYIRRADGILLFYSIATRSSFEQCHKLRTNILRIKNEDTTFPVILVGAKSDLTERAVKTIEGIELARKWKMSFLEVSPKNGNNIERLFQRITLEVISYGLANPEKKKKE